MKIIIINETISTGHSHGKAPICTAVHPSVYSGMQLQNSQPFNVNTTLQLPCENNTILLPTDDIPNIFSDNTFLSALQIPQLFQFSQSSMPQQ